MENETTQPQQPQPEPTTRPAAPPPAPEKRRLFEVTMSEPFNLIAGALARAQGKYHPVVKNCEGKVTYPARGDRAAGSYTFMYADLGAVIDATKEALATEEIAHTTLICGGKLRVMLLHSSGQWMASEAPLASPADGMHPFGSQITYLRRYLLAPLLGVASEDDDDGNGATTGNTFNKTKGNGQPQQSSATPRAATAGDPVADGKAAAEKARKMESKPTANKITPAQITKLGETMDALPEFVKLQETESDPVKYNGHRLAWINSALGRSAEKGNALTTPRDITQEELAKLLAVVASGGTQAPAQEGGAK